MLELVIILKELLVNITAFLYTMRSTLNRASEAHDQRHHRGRG